MIKTTALLLAAASLGSIACAAQPDPEQAAIAQVLENYRTAVNTSDEALFTTTIIDDEIPFFAVTARTEQKGATAAETRDVASFRRGVFHGGEALIQTFDHMEITRHDGLAQASFHWITALKKDPKNGGEGWKAITLMKLKGEWKIAAEFYTAGPLKS